MASRSSREQLIANCRWLFNKEVQVITFVTPSSTTPSKLHYVAAALSKDCNLESVVGNDHDLDIIAFEGELRFRKSEIEEKTVIKAFSLLSTDDAILSLNESIEEEIGTFLKESSTEKGWELRLTGSGLPPGYPQTLCDRVQKNCVQRVPTTHSKSSLGKEIASLKQEIAALRKSNANNKRASLSNPFQLGSHSFSSSSDTKNRTPSSSAAGDSATEPENTSSGSAVMQTWDKLKAVHEQHEWLFSQQLLGNKRMERYVRQDLAELAASILTYLGEGEEKDLDL